MVKRTRGNAGINKLLKRDKKDFITVGLLIVICLTAFNVIFSDMYIYNGAMNSPASFCQSCTSSQYVYYPSSEGYSMTVDSGYTFTKSFILEDYINYEDMSREYESYYYYVADKNTLEVLYSSGTKNFYPRDIGYTVTASESFSVAINKSTVLQLMVFGVPAGAYGVGTEMEYNIGHRPTWAFFVNNAVPTGYVCGGNFGCPIGYYCSSGTCLPIQNVNNDPTATLCMGSYGCPTGYDCLNGICQTATTPTQPTSSTGDSGSTSPPPITPVTPTTPATTTNGTTTTTTTTNTSATDPFNTVKYNKSKDIPISMGTPCDKWAESKVGFLVEWAPELAGPVVMGLNVICLGYKVIAYGASLPTIILLNIVNTFNYICASSFGFGFGYLLPFVLTIIFLLLLLVPDDIISFGVGVFLMYILGTTAPVAGTMSVLTALGGGFATIGTATNLFVLGGALEIGPKAIFWILFLLAVKETFYSQGALTVPFVSYRKKGDDIIPTEKSMTVRYGSGISQLRHVIAEALFVVLGAMWVECHWGIPVYTAVLGAIDAIIQGIQIVGGAI